LQDIYKNIKIAKEIIAHQKIGSVGLNQIHTMLEKLGEE
jgi:hypothetical protein